MTEHPIPNTPPSYRDHRWLEARLKHLWETYYADIPPGYPIQIRFGRRARTRFGSIASRNGVCLIRINALFAHPDVPDYVIDATITHELAHYAHGYGSGLPKLHANPHQGGVVEEELRKRGCHPLKEKAEAWRRAHWDTFYETHAGDAVARRSLRGEVTRRVWEGYLGQSGFRTQADLRTRLARLCRIMGITEAPFTVEWLHASAQHIGISYYFSAEKTLRFHGVAADPKVPDEVIDFELAYWLTAVSIGKKWNVIAPVLRRLGLWPVAEKAIQWRQRAWTRFRKTHHPLRTG